VKDNSEWTQEQKTILFSPVSTLFCMISADFSEGDPLIVIHPPVIPVRNEKVLPFQALFELY